MQRTFPTPGPVEVVVEFGVGALVVEASDRPDTVVEVRPSDPAKRGDVATAERTEVAYLNGVVTVRAPKNWRRYSIRGGAESIDVRIEVPVGSSMSGDAGVADVLTAGPLGACRLKTGVGALRVAQAASANLRTGAGDLTVEDVVGDLEASTSTGSLHVGRVGGSASVKNSNGSTWVDEVAGELTVRAANGPIAVRRAHAGVTAKSAMGDIRVDEVEAGVVAAQTAFGKVEIGVLDGVAAWLDMHTSFGTLRSELDAAGRPGPDDPTVEIRARTSFGDVVIRRALAEQSTGG